MDIQKEREAFEVWLFSTEKFKFRNKNFLFMLDESGVYEDEPVLRHWETWQAARADVPEGFVLVEREKLAMIFETATNALVYHAAPPKHDALSIIQGIARKAMIEAQEPAND